MGRNQSESVRESSASYRVLYAAIKRMNDHGVSKSDDRVVDLAKQLRDYLDSFAQNDNRLHDDVVRYKFRDTFLTTLNDRESLFSNQPDVQMLIRNMHKLLYTEVFSKAEHLRPLSFFPKESDEAPVQAPSPRAGQ